MFQNVAPFAKLLPMRFPLAALLACFCASLRVVAAPVAAPASIVTLDTPRDFPAIANLDQWRAGAQTIREQILVSSGLWPMPEKTPLQAKVFGRIVRDGY